MTNIYTNSAIGPVTFDALSAAMKKMPPAPTAAQKEWAKMAGFPGYPGFKVSQDVWLELRKQMESASSLIDLIGCVPIVVDDKLPPGTIMSAERLWEDLQRFHAEYGAKLEWVNPEGETVSMDNTRRWLFRWR